ncbi:hypothetical protein [Occallatibacter savannae]|uniref:hypothetical protein n=1 Tax=Occallatibacter savannae TaxID=1002691 RepID=UPI000D6980C5|nr:hypothetical protein [Occallatibacter savannae]
MPRKMKVVITHHEKVIADTLATILRQSNVDATAFYANSAAIEPILSIKPDIAILCIVPLYDEFNGVWAAVAVRGLVPSCHIMLIPGGSGDWVIGPLTLASERGYEFEIIPEPVHPQELLDMLRARAGEDIEPIGSQRPAAASWAAPQQESSPYPVASKRSGLLRKFASRFTRGK